MPDDFSKEHLVELSSDIKELWLMVNRSAPTPSLARKLIESWRRIEEAVSQSAMTGHGFDQVFEDSENLGAIIRELKQRGRHDVLRPLEELLRARETPPPQPAAPPPKQEPCDFGHPCTCGTDHR